MTLSDMRKIDKAWRPPKAEHGARAIADLAATDDGTGMIHYPGLEAAVIGTVERCGQPDLVCYSRARIVAILQLRDGMSKEDAEDYIDFNITGAWMGDLTPVVLS